MLKVFVDSGSSIKESEKDKLGVEIIPLRYFMGETEYRDGIDLSIGEFYEKLIKQKLFPKTSLPDLEELRQKVTECTEKGDDVIILTISSKISGTFANIQSLFKDNRKVWVVDSLSAVGGIRILVGEINRMRDRPVDTILARINALIPKIKVYAIPETLDYLLRGGRLTKQEWTIGSILQIKPIITLQQGEVKVFAKKIGLKKSMKYIADLTLESADCYYPIIPSYTYNENNLKTLIGMLNDRVKPALGEYDNLDPVIASHWGPNAFGFIFIGK